MPVFQVCLSSGVTTDDVAEVFSMPRVVPEAAKRGLKGTKSYDFGAGWNFLNASHRKQCIEEIKQSSPRVLLVSPPCAMYSAWQRLNAVRCGGSERRRVEAHTLLLFGIQLCELQQEMGNYFIFEHPLGARSWHVPAWRKLCHADNVNDVHVDQCMYGLRDPCNHKLYRKPTKLRTNCPHVQCMACKCDGSHEHQVVEGQVKVAGAWVDRSKVAQVYPKALVSKFVWCVRQAMRERETEVLYSAGVGRQEKVFVGALETEEVVCEGRATAGGPIRASEHGAKRATDCAATEKVLGNPGERNRASRENHDVFTSERRRSDNEKDRALIESVRRCHVNLGHPSQERFLHMLRSASASEAAVKVAKNLKCSVCDSKKGPPSRPVAKARRAESFNEQVNVDTFELPIYQEEIAHA